MSALRRKLPLAVIVPAAVAGQDPAAVNRVFDFAEQVVHWQEVPSRPGPNDAASLRAQIGSLRAGLVCRLATSPGNYGLCLGNGGDELGEARPGGPLLTCPPALARDLRDAAAAALAGWPEPILLNRPAAGCIWTQALAEPGRPWLLLQAGAGWGQPDALPGPGPVRRSQRLAGALAVWCRLQDW